MRKGFSLVELMVVMAILGVISSILIATLAAGQQTWQVEQARMTVSAELRRGIDSMSREVASTQAAQLSIPADGNWYNTLTFRVPFDVDGNGTVLDNVTGALEWSPQITYSLGGNGGNQIQRTQNAAVQILANGATVLQFRRQAATPSILEINVTVQRGNTTSNFPNTGTLNTRVRLRN